MALISVGNASSPTGGFLGGTPVVLPITEAAADSNTFVCEFTGGAAANETGVGGGLTGADLVLTQVGGVPASVGGFRQLASPTTYFDCTNSFIQNFIDGTNPFTWMWQVNDLTEYIRNDGGLFYFDATAGARFYFRLQTTDGFGGEVSARDGVTVISTGMSTYLPGGGWAAIFFDGTDFWCGAKTGLTEPPTRTDDFDSCLVKVPGMADFSAVTFDIMTTLIFGNFKIGRMVASKLSLGTP